MIAKSSDIFISRYYYYLLLFFFYFHDFVQYLFNNFLLDIKYCERFLYFLINDEDFFVFERTNTMARFLEVDRGKIAREMPYSPNNPIIKDSLHRFLCNEMVRNKENFNCETFLKKFFSLCSEISILKAYRNSLELAIGENETTEKKNTSITNDLPVTRIYPEEQRTQLNCLTSSFQYLTDRFLYLLAKQINHQSSFELSLEVFDEMNTFDDLERDNRHDILTLKRKNLQNVRRQLLLQIDENQTIEKKEQEIIENLCKIFKKIQRLDLEAFIRQKLTIECRPNSSSLFAVV